MSLLLSDLDLLNFIISNNKYIAVLSNSQEENFAKLLNILIKKTNKITVTKILMIFIVIFFNIIEYH